MPIFSSAITTFVAVSPIEAFEYNVPIDLASIFTGYGPLPAVIGVKDQTGAWDGAGQRRIVLLSDGSSAQEILTQYEHPNYFSYTVSDFTGILRFLIVGAKGEWWFSRVPSGETHIRWRYGFESKNILTSPLLWVITNLLWRGYMKKALKLYVAQLSGKKI